MSLMETLKQSDPEVAAQLDKELNRQRSKLELIASENIVSPAVMAAMALAPRVLTAVCSRMLPMAVMEYCIPIGRPMASRRPM